MSEKCDKFHLILPTAIVTLIAWNVFKVNKDCLKNVFTQFPHRLSASSSRFPAAHPMRFHLNGFLIKLIKQLLTPPVKTSFIANTDDKVLEWNHKPMWFWESLSCIDIVQRTVMREEEISTYIA